jgi:DNA-binding FrmR family transcriptional regulator
MPINSNSRARDVERSRKPLEGERRADVVNRLKSARGHIDHILAMIDEDAYVLDLLRQIAAVRGAVDATTRIALRHYFERVFANQVRDGEVESAAGELMTALRFMRQID